LKSIMKSVIILALIFTTVVFAQDKDAVSTDTTELVGASQDVKDLVHNATLALLGKYDWTPSAAEVLTIQGNVNVTLKTFIDLMEKADSPTVTVAALKAAYATYSATLAGKFAAWNVAKADFLTNLNGNVSLWKEKVAELDQNRSIAVTDGKSFVERATAVFKYEAVKLAGRWVALGLVATSFAAQEAELRFRIELGRLVAINNSIYLKDNTALDIPWTPLTTKQVLAGVLQVAIAAEIAHWRLTHLATVVGPAVIADLQEAAQSLKDQATKFIQGVYAKLQELKTQWEANKDKIKAAIADRVRDFLENVNKTTVEITIKADGNISLALRIIRDEVVGEIRDKIKAYIASHLKILIAVYAQTELANVTIIVGDPTTKRDALGQSTWDSTAQIGSTQEGGSGEVADSAGALVASVGLLAAVVAALLF
jgi:hypothetical protein